MDNSSDITIQLPSAEALDTGAHSESSGYRMSLYLVPAAETEAGVPRVAIHSGLGTIGHPVRAYHKRWLALGDYGAGVVGESVLEQLVEATDLLVELSSAYQGASWDGHNMIGSWDLPDDFREAVVVFDPDSVRCYWDASAWFGPNNIGWDDLCVEAGVEPERALGQDWESVAEEVAEVIAPLQEAPVTGTADYAREAASRYRDEQFEKSDLA